MKDVARLLHRRTSGPTSTSQVRILEFPRYAHVRAVVPQHHPVLGGDRLHRPRARRRQGRHRLPVLRHRARGRAPVVGAPGRRRRRAGRDRCSSETLAQYSALMVMEQKYGDAKMQQLPRSTSSTATCVGRGGEQQEGAAARRASRTRTTSTTGRAALVMYALQDYIGEDNVNRALHALRRRSTRSRARRTRTRSTLIDALRAVTPPEYAVRDRRPVRDDHALRQPRDAGHGATAAGRPVRGHDHGRRQQAQGRRPRQRDATRRSTTGSTSASPTPTAASSTARRRT